MMLYHINKQPKDSVYRKLIDTAICFCNSGLLVVRETINLDESGTKVIQGLERFITEKTRSSKWPGTILLCNEAFPNNVATIYSFRFCLDSAEILKNSVKGLYSWRQPEYPEDLCLLRPDGSPWLVSITHENDSYLRLATEEEITILNSIPELGPFTIRPLEEERQ